MPFTLYAIQLEPLQADTPFYHLLDPCARQLGSPRPDPQRLQYATTSDRGNRCAERRVEEQCVYAKVSQGRRRHDFGQVVKVVGKVLCLFTQTIGS